MHSFSRLLSCLCAATLALASPISVPAPGNSTHGAVKSLDIPEGHGNTLASKKPFYAIAHRCNNVGAINQAVNDGANAFEMDLTSETNGGWWASHDGPSKNGDKARDMFNAVAGPRKAGRPITFGWLDLKNPDYCDPADSKWWYCSIAALRDLAREILEPAGVRVLFGFYGDDLVNGNAYKLLASGLTAKEAINNDGRSAPLQQWFSAHGPSAVSKRVMSYGYMDITNGFGNCWEAGDAHLTCTQIRQGVASHNFGKVFGWTANKDNGGSMSSLMDVGVDGIIFGNSQALYGGATASQAAKVLRSSLQSHGSSYFMAGNNDAPW